MLFPYVRNLSKPSAEQKERVLFYVEVQFILYKALVVRGEG